MKKEENKTVTNLLMEVWCSYFNEKVSKRKLHWEERFILGGHRKELDRLTEIGEKSDDDRPWIVVGQDDDLWWNDDMMFVLDRFCENDLEPNKTVIGGMDWPKGLEEFYDKIRNREYDKVGETLTYEHKGLKIKVTADCSDVSKGKLKFL